MPVARRLQFLNNRVFNRITRAEIREGLERLGLSQGAVVYAHVCLSSIGYVMGGPEEVAGAILDVIGPEGTLMMACSAAEAARVDPAAVFDVRETSSGMGLVSEALRAQPRAHRSLHPVASVVAVGARAAELIAGHDALERPFGTHGPWGRLSRMQPRLLLVGANLGAILRFVQDQVDFPNLYDREPVDLEVRDAEGRYKQIRSFIVRADVPPLVILPGGRPEGRDYILLADYALMFPSDRERLVIESGYLRFNRSRFLGRRERLRARGILVTGAVGLAEAALLDGARLLEQIVKDLAWDLARNKEDYEAGSLADIGLPIL